MDFLITSGARAVFDDEAKRLGATLHYLRFSRATILSFVPGIRKILRQSRYAAAHDHQGYASGWHFLAAGGALPPIRIVHVHNSGYQIGTNYGTFARRQVARLGKRLIARHATSILGTSRQVLTEYGFDDEQFARIPKRALYCGIDTRRFIGDPNASRASICAELEWPLDSLIFLVAGRIDRSADPGDPESHKNSAFAVSVAIELARRESRARVIFAGSPSPAVRSLQQRIDDAGFSGRISFLGVRNDIDRLMLASDALLFPSRGEGLGMVAVEAQAAGLPVLASTAVPRECVVVHDLVRFRDVSTGPVGWAVDLLELASQPTDRRAANHLVSESPFSIEFSSREVLRAYKGD